ncbi:MAG: RagB/SusD family nutrient uptake outer membrane protein, partial [Chitinophagaceae bacterium]
MKKKIFLISFAYLLIIGMSGCEKELTIENPNSPTPESANTESGIKQFAIGGIYVNGFRDLKYTDGVFGPFWSGATGFHELMGDVIGCDAANAFMNQIGCPEKVTHDDGQAVNNPNSPNTQLALIRANNVNSQAANNTLYYEWAYMYNLVGACNLLLEKAEEVTLTGDAASKKAAIKAIAYWWKGFAYSRIGSTYIAGLLVDKYLETNSNYVSKEKMIEEGNKLLDLAVTTAKSAPNVGNYTAFVAELYPTFFQVGKGLPITPSMLERNVNTLKARNILVNKTTTAMTPADWNNVLTLVNIGLTDADNIFTARTNDRGDLYSSGQLIPGRTISTLAGGARYKISERWAQEFKTGDKRLQNNLKQTTPYLGQADRGNAHFTR